MSEEFSPNTTLNEKNFHINKVVEEDFIVYEVDFDNIKKLIQDLNIDTIEFKNEDKINLIKTKLNDILNKLEKINFTNSGQIAVANEIRNTLVKSKEKIGERIKKFKTYEFSENIFNDKNKFYRVIIGNEAFEDLKKNNVVRTNADSKKKIGGGISFDRPTAFPSFSKGGVSVEYAFSNPNHYIIVTEDKVMKPSNSGRHGKGTTMFPTDEKGRHLKELSGDKVEVYQHVGDRKYKLVYDRGQVVNKNN